MKNVFGFCGMKDGLAGKGKKTEGGFIFRSQILGLFLIFLLFVSCGKGKGNEVFEKMYLEAVEQYTLHNFEEAKKLLEGIKKSGVKNFQADFLEAKICFFTGDFLQGQKMLSVLTKNHPEFTEARLWEIRCCLMCEDLERAEELLKKEIVINPTDWRGFYLYSLLFQKKGSLDEELVMLKNAEISLEDSAKVYASMAKVWGVLGMQGREESYFKKAMLIGNFDEE